MLLLLVVDDGHIGMLEYRQNHGQHRERSSRQREQKRLLIDFNRQRSALYELQERVGRAQNLHQIRAQRHARNQSDTRQYNTLNQIGGDDLLAGSASALEYRNFVLLHIEHLPGHHEDEGRQQNENRNLQHPQRDVNLLRDLQKLDDGIVKVGAVILSVEGFEMRHIRLGGIQNILRLIAAHGGIVHHEEQLSIQQMLAALLHEQAFEDTLRHHALALERSGRTNPVKVLLLAVGEHAADADAQRVAVRAGDFRNLQHLAQQQVHVHHAAFADHDVDGSVLVGRFGIHLAAQNLDVLVQIIHHTQRERLGRAVLTLQFGIRLERADIVMLNQFLLLQAKVFRHAPDGLRRHQHFGVAGNRAAGLDVDRSGIIIGFVQIIGQALGQRALKHSLSVHGVGGRNAHQQDIADQESEHHPLFIDHLSKDKTKHVCSPPL